MKSSSLLSSSSTLKISESISNREKIVHSVKKPINLKLLETAIKKIVLSFEIFKTNFPKKNLFLKADNRIF